MRIKFSSIGFNEYIDEMLEKKEKEDAQALEREDKLFSLALQYGKDQAKFLSGSKYSKALASNKILRQNLSTADLTEEDLKFFEPILNDPFASQFVEDFITKQKGQGLDIRYSMLPDMLNIIPSSAPEQEKIDYIERITGEDFSGDKGYEKYKKLATQIVSMPTEIRQSIFVSAKPGVGVNVKNRDAYNKEMVKKVEAQVMPLARRMQKTLLSERGTSDNEVQRLTRLIKQVESAGTGSEVALQQLIEAVKYDKESFDELVRLYEMDFIGWEKNPFLSSIPELFPDLD